MTSAPEPDGEARKKRGKTSEKKSDVSGHRGRLRERFLSDPDLVPDYELLELILFLSYARMDVKPLAKKLLAEFGSFAAVISAAPEALERVGGLGRAGIAALKTVEAGAHRLLLGQIMNQPALSSWDRILDYCHARMDYQKVEQFRLLFLDKQNRLIADEVQQTGTLDRTAVYPREVVRRALDLHASAVIMIHNHPSGDPTPSAADQDMTLKVRDALRVIEVELHDHVVIARGGHISFRSQGLF